MKGQRSMRYRNKTYDRLVACAITCGQASSKYSTRNGMAELYAITAYFNPVNYKSRKLLHEQFAARMKDQNIPLIVAECAIDGQEFAVTEAC